MKFLYPEFLYALGAISIPVIIHLFNFRKFKKVHFSDVHLLKEIKQETKSRAQLKHWLLLACRILAIAALVIAFAQPYFPVDDTVRKAGNNIVSIYIDNSYSTDSQSENGYVLQEEKNHAIEQVEQFGSSDQFHLVTNEFGGHLQRLFSKEEIIPIIEEIQPTPATRKLSEVIIRQRDVLKAQDSPNKLSFLFSDFQKSICDFNQIKSDTAISTKLIKFQSNQDENFYIDSIWFATPLRKLNEEEKLYARIYNLSDKDAEVRLELAINQKAQGFNNFIIPANNYSDCALTYTIYQAGIQEGELQLADYPNPDLPFDDTFFFSYTVSESLPILIISEQSTDTTKGVGGAYGLSPLFDLTFNRPGAIDYAQFTAHNLIVLDELESISSGLIAELSKFVQNGGHVLLLPAEKVDQNSYNELLLAMQAGRMGSKVNSEMKVSQLNLEHPLYTGVFERIPRNVDLPISKARYPLTLSSRNKFDYLMRLQNGDPFLTQHRVGNGFFYFAAASGKASFGNFGKHALYVTTLLRIGEFSQFSHPLYSIIGNTNSIDLKNESYRAENIEIKHQNGQNFIPGLQEKNGTATLLFHDQVKEAGFYQLYDQNKAQYSFGWNYNRFESDPTTLNAEEITADLNRNNLNSSFQLIDASSIQGNAGINNVNGQEKYWKWFILLALLFLALEILIYRLFK